MGLLVYGLCCSGDNVFAIERIESDAKIVGIAPLNLNLPIFSVRGGGGGGAVSPLCSLMSVCQHGLSHMNVLKKVDLASMSLQEVGSYVLKIERKYTIWLNE